MAVSVVVIRSRPRGSEIVVDDNGTERVFGRKDWWTHNNAVTGKPVRKWSELFAAEKSNLLEWATPLLVAARRASQEVEEEEAAVDVAFSLPAFKTWLVANWNRGDVRPLLRPIARIYKDEA